MSWGSDLWGQVTGAAQQAVDTTKNNLSNAQSAVKTWGNGQSGDWNPAASSLFTGKGTPWSAGNTNSPLDYVKGVFTTLPSLASQALPALTNGQTPSFSSLDTSGSQNIQDQQAAQKRKGDQENSDYANQQATNAAAADAQTQAANTLANGQNALNKQDTLEQQMMDEYRKRQAGNKLNF